MSIRADSSDNNTIVCKPEYFMKCNNRPCYECLLRCVSRVNTHYSAILITVLQIVYEKENTVSEFFFNINYYPFPPTKMRHYPQCPKVER
jgi:hypothetical protein